MGLVVSKRLDCFNGLKEPHQLFYSLKPYEYQDSQCYLHFLDERTDTQRK